MAKTDYADLKVAFAELEDQMEPTARKWTDELEKANLEPQNGQFISDYAQMSIAVSLKRIADVLEDLVGPHGAVIGSVCGDRFIRTHRPAVKWVFKLSNGSYLSAKKVRVTDSTSPRYMETCSDTTPDLQEARVFTTRGSAAGAARQAFGRLASSDGRAVLVGLVEQELPL